jgi:crotonobetainyl-CoA:carnitine CoA-transferase CaiB-like acyl-CoA transferase
MEPAYWRRFCAAIGKPELADRQHDTAAHPAMQAEIAAVLRTRTRDEWFALLSEAETQAMPVYGPAEALIHPHNRARGMIVEVPLGGQDRPLTQLGLSFTFSETAAVPPRAAGPAGADNAAILAELGFDTGALAAAGAFSTEGRDRA